MLDYVATKVWQQYVNNQGQFTPVATSHNRHCMFVHKCIYGTASVYLTNVCVTVYQSQLCYIELILFHQSTMNYSCFVARSTKAEGGILTTNFLPKQFHYVVLQLLNPLPQSVCDITFRPFTPSISKNLHANILLFVTITCKLSADF